MISSARPPVAITVHSPELGLEPVDERVDLAAEPVDRARLDRLDRRLADHVASAATSSTRRSAAARPNSASIEISMPGKIAPPRYSPFVADRLDRVRGAEVDDDRRAAVEVVRARPRWRCGRRRPPSGCRRGSACRCARRARARAPGTRSSARSSRGSAAVTRGTPDAIATPVTVRRRTQKPWKPRNCWIISASSSDVRSATVAMRQWSTSSLSVEEPDDGLGVAGVDARAAWASAPSSRRRRPRTQGRGRCRARAPTA